MGYDWPEWMGNVIDFRKFYDIITAFPRVLGEKYDAIGFLPAAAVALCGMCLLWVSATL